MSRQRSTTIDVTDDPMWNHFLERVAIVEGRWSKAEALAVTHDDQFWAWGEPPRLYRVIEWL